MAKKSKKLEGAVVDQKRMDYASTFGSEGGKRVLEDIMALCHVLELEPDAVPENIVARAHRRDVAHHILINMGYGPRDFPKIIEDISNG